MTLHRGDIVLVNFPFSSGAGSKLRPALIVQSDHNNQRLTNAIIVAITTTTRRRHEPTQLFIDIGTPAGVQSGLLHNSVVTCENVLTMAQSLVHRKLGQLPPATMRQVDACLKSSLGLP